MNKGIVKEGILGVLKLRLQSTFKNYRSRVTNKELYRTCRISTTESVAGK